jgi:hypothetical protein
MGAPDLQRLRNAAPAARQMGLSDLAARQLPLEPLQLTARPLLVPARRGQVLGLLDAHSAQFLVEGVGPAQQVAPGEVHLGCRTARQQLDQLSLDLGPLRCKRTRPSSGQTGSYRVTSRAPRVLSRQSPPERLGMALQSLQVRLTVGENSNRCGNLSTYAIGMN